MLEGQIEKSSRASKPKVRTGCITCNWDPSVRRVKCDETKPDCLRCTSTGRKCDGYAILEKGKAKAVVSTRPIGTYQISLVANPSDAIPGDEKESRYFGFFCNRTIPQITGIFESNFWQRLLLQTSRHEPAVRHAVVALASAHEQFGIAGLVSSDYEATVEGAFPLQQYNQAINHLIRPISNRGQQAADVCLICCILFACLETLRGHYGSAISHISSGVKILSALRSPQGYQQCYRGVVASSSTPYVPLESLELLFCRLNSQARQMIDGPPMHLHPKTRNQELGFGPDLPISFSSVEEARNSLDFHWNGCLAAVDFKDDADRRRGLAEKYKTIFKRWLEAFRAFLEQSASGFDSRDVKAAAVLDINHRFAAIHFDSILMAFPADQTSWDKYRAEHEEIVSLAAKVIDTYPSASGAASRREPSFSIETNVVPPLYLVAHRCRDPVIRRKAISLLAATPRQEGVWNSALVAKVTQRIVEIEEGGLLGVESFQDVPQHARTSETKLPVPGWARVSDVDVHLDLERRRATVDYIHHQTALNETSATITDVLEW